MNRPPASLKNVTGTGTVQPGACVYKGVAIRDTSGVTNTVKIYDNTAATGTLVLAVQLAANASFAESLPDGAWCTTGLHLTSTGAIEGSVRIG